MPCLRLTQPADSLRCNRLIPRFRRPHRSGTTRALRSNICLTYGELLLLKLGPLALGVRDPAGNVNHPARLELGKNPQVSNATRVQGCIDVHIQTERLKPLARAGESLATDQWAIV